jgi:hypothetical protein
VHDALKEVLRKALPRMVGASVMVSDELLENGGDEAFTKYLHRQLSNTLKVLDGADESCFSMRPDEELAATRCEARLHVLTPKELEALMEQAFAAGRRLEFRGGGSIKDYPPMKQPWDNRPYIKQISKEERKRIEAIMVKDWEEVFADFKPTSLEKKR